MNEHTDKNIFRPGFYGKKRMSPSDWVGIHIKNWEKQISKKKQDAKPSEAPCHICISRKIGVGALEIADLLSERLNYRVIDREIIEYMAGATQLTEKMIEFYDERYPGRTREFFSMMTGKKAFSQSDYARQLVKTVTALAEIEPTVFVGRGTHLILPRDKVLSVRLVCCREVRVRRLSGLLKIDAAEAQRQLKVVDTEQRDFFKKVFRKKETSSDEFDIVINRDYFENTEQISQILATAFELRFNSRE